MYDRSFRLLLPIILLLFYLLSSIMPQVQKIAMKMSQRAI